VTTSASRTIRIGLLLLAVLVSAWVSLAVVNTPSQVPTLWPAGGVVAGLLLTSPRRLRPWLTGSSLFLIVVAYLVHGYPLVPSLGYSVSFVAASWLVRNLLVKGLDGRRAALRDTGDVSRFVGAIAAGSLLAGVGYGFTNWVAGQGNPLLGALGAFGASAAAVMVLLPLFLETVTFDPIAGLRERLVQAVLTLGTTVAVFVNGASPPVMFAVMPMFAWHAFRGTLREATVLLTLVGAIGTSLTVLKTGPVWALGDRYGLSTELVLLDCGLILLPISVMVTQQRMSADRADAERETLQRLVASATGTAIIATGPDGLITLFNPGAEAMLGYSATEVVGKRPDMFHPQDELRHQASRLNAQPTFADICRASIAAEDTHRLWLFRRQDGEERIMRMTLTAVAGQGGELSGYLATAEDVTEREKAHRAMLLTVQHQRTAVERLQELERVKGDFVSTVSHELRTPITSIIGYTELLEDGLVGELTAAQSEVIDRLDRNGRRLLLLVEDLLTLSQIEASSLKIQPVVTDIRAAVKNAYRALATTLATRKLDVVLTTPDEPVVHHGDPVQLERMVTNLMTNAVKFTPDGGTVELTLCSDGEVSQIVVKDAMHGGKIAVASAYGQGTTVTVSIPRVALVATSSVTAACAVESRTA